MKRSLYLIVLAFTALFSADASAQQTSLYAQNQLSALSASSSASYYSVNRINRSIYNSAVPQFGYSKANQGVFNAPQLGATKSKPFSNFASQGSVTPWLGLSQPFSSPTTNYFTNVRPQLDQQRANQQMASRNAQLQRQLNSLAAQPPYDPTGNENMAPTGHAAVYMNYGGYYTPVQPTKGRR